MHRNFTSASFQIVFLSLLIALLPAISSAARSGGRRKDSNYGGGGGGDIQTANGEFSNFIPEAELTGPIDFSGAEEQSDGSLCVIKTKMIDKERQNDASSPFSSQAVNKHGGNGKSLTILYHPVISAAGGEGAHQGVLARERDTVPREAPQRR